MVLIMNPEIVSSISTKTGVMKMIRMFGEQQQVSRKVMENLDQAGISQQIGVFKTGAVACLLLLFCVVPTHAQQVGDMYKNCKYWALSDFPKQLEFKKSNYAAFQCNEVFRSYRMSGKVHCQLVAKGLSGFVPPFDGYAFDAPTNDALIEMFLRYAEENPRDWNKNVYAVLWKFTAPFRCS